MKPAILLVAAALAMAPVMLVPEASAHLVCVDFGCNCPPERDGIHVHVNIGWFPSACVNTGLLP
ncbi:MAG TPA: hypothetical protein VNX21_08245 [Candidatus Thermoplasmatota archaeon]|nr:hypothetical protein [Candidatus Thermoplasmatota archaeon]